MRSDNPSQFITAHYRLFGWVSEKLMMFPVKVAVLLTCLSLLSMGVYGMTKLKMEFRPEWMLDPESECEMFC